MKSNSSNDLAAGLSSRLTNWFGKAIIAVAMLLAPLAIGLVLDFDTGSTTYAASGGGNNGSGKGGSNGNGGSGPDKGDLYGDMVYLLRDVNGIPILDPVDCLQPIAADGSILPLNWWIEPYPVPEICEDAEELLISSEESEDPDDCDVIIVCADNMVEVELGRLSVLRSPAKVLDRQRDEFIRNIKKAEHQLRLDEGGRLQVPGLLDDWVTFDSPLINLALMREFHLWGVIWDDVNNDGVIDEDEIAFDPELLDDPSTGSPYHTYGFFLAAAFGLGAGDDKEGMGIDVDVVARVNSILGLADTIADIPGVKPGFEIFEHALGNFIDYSAHNYSRADTYPGCVEWDEWDENLAKWVEKQDTILNAVFTDEYGVPEADPGLVWNVAGYALSANDARRVMLFTHDIGEDALRGRVDPVFHNSGDFCP
jgi:hypothetical protein